MPNQTTCGCGCGQDASGREFLAGHANSLRARLVREAAAGNQSSTAELQRRGWPLSYAIFRNRAGRPAQFTAATRPAMQSRKFGVEIEFTGIMPELVVQKAAALGLEIRIESYNHTTRGYWKLVTDASCGHELVSPPITGEQGREEVRKAAQALREAGAVVTRSCGLHVHFDIADFDMAEIRRLIASYTDNQNHINSVLAPSRRFNQFAAPYTTQEVTGLGRIRTLRQLSAMAERGNRYKAVNLCSYGRHGTIEFRQHQGTLNAEKILNWLAFCEAMIAAVKENRAPSGRANIAELLQVLNVAPEIQNWFAERALELNS